MLCARTDLHLPLDRLTWQGDRSAIYLCYQAVFRPRPSTGVLSRTKNHDATLPLRIVVFGESEADSRLIAAWMAEHAGHYELRSRCPRVLSPGVVRGKSLIEERYVVYELIPRRCVPP